MIDGERVLGIIPARGGSKGVPRKNLRPLAGKPLLAWSIEAGKRAACIDRLVLSSDDDEIMTVARQHGCEVPYRRPVHLAADSSPTIDVVLDLLDFLPESYGYVVLLQPTSPLRSAADIDHAAATCSRLNAPACVSVVPAERSPYWMYTVGADGTMTAVLPQPPGTRRQDLPAIYTLNGAVYVARCDWLRQYRKFSGHGSVAYVMPPERSIDIDTDLDFVLAAAILEHARIARSATSEPRTLQSRAPSDRNASC